MTGLPYLMRVMGFGLRAPKARVRGTDVSGTVEAAGKNVTRFQAGDDVFGTCDGSFAEHTRAREDKLAPKLDAIKDCAMLYVAAIGGSGAARVVAMKIHPVKVPKPEAISEILDKLQTVLQGTPPPWLRKALAKDAQHAPNFEEDEVTQ